MTISTYCIPPDNHISSPYNETKCASFMNEVWTKPSSPVHLPPVPITQLTRRPVPIPTALTATLLFNHLIADSSHCRSDQNLNIWPPSRVPPYRLVYGLPYRSRVMALRYSVDRPTVQGHHNTSHIRSFSTSKPLQEEKWSTSTKTFATIINLH